jgi:cbb3-type cytochrome oxidase subunit 1
VRPSLVAHGAWNALVATSFAVTSGTTKTAAFTGNDALLGEFGWIAAITTAFVGAAAGIWHVRHPNPRAQVSGAIAPPAA